MGQAIVYCSNCSAQLRGADFETKKAFKVDEHIFCAKCCREIMGHEPDAAVTSSSAKSRIPPYEAPPTSSSTKTKVPQRPPSSTNRIMIVPPPAESEGSIGLYV